MKSSTKQTVIYPGFPKTGTTYLQNLMRNHPQICVLGSHPSFENTVLSIDDWGFDQKYFHQILQQEQAEKCREQHDTVVLTQERMTMHPYVIPSIPKRLHQEFPDARLVFTIRNQFKSIVSFYKGRAFRLGGLVDFPEDVIGDQYGNQPLSFGDYLKMCYEEWSFRLFSCFDYGSVIKEYLKYYPKENINILLFERFAGQEEIFWERLSSALGVKPETLLELKEDEKTNPSLGKQDLQNYQVSQQITGKLGLGKLPVIGDLLQTEAGEAFKNSVKTMLAKFMTEREEAVLSKEWEQKLAEKYRPANQFLVESFGLPLKQYGYPLPE